MKRLYVVAVCAIAIILSGCGVSQVEYDTAVSEKDNIKAAYDAVVEASGSKEEIEAEVSSLKANVEAQQAILASTEKAIADNQEIVQKISDHEELIAQYEAREAELTESITDLETRENELSGNVSELETQRDSLQTQVDNLGKVVLERAGEPIKVSPGYYTFGEDNDVPAGRYVVTGILLFAHREISLL